ncbi:MAG: hypothetical protein KDC83_15545, partial [Flavobacteriales bacterium]|nr:hypothetical protein [Flavobacteriales bacterium]
MKNKRKLKWNFHSIKFIITIVMIAIYSGTSFGQREINFDLNSHIKKSVIKNIALGQILEAKRSFTSEANQIDGYVISSFVDWKYIQFPGFGYLPDELECLIKPVEIPYPDTSWNLYQISFVDNLKNDSLVSWSNYSQRIPALGKNMLVGVNKSMEIKFISGIFPFKNRIAKDFDLNKNNPTSFLPFLQLKLYSNQYNRIEFTRQENDTLVFSVGYNEKEEFKYVFEIYIDPQNPDGFGGKHIRGITYERLTRPKPKVKFKDFEDKERYLLNALMKNAYMHRVLNLPNLENRLNLDSSVWVVKEGVSDFDKLLPDFDEYWNRIEPVTFNLKFANGNCSEAWAGFRNGLITEGNHTIVGNTMYDGVEFYRFYKDTLETLSSCQNNDEYSKLGCCCRIHYYYYPEEKKKHDEWIDQKGYPPPPPPPMPEILRFGGDPKCLPYNLPFSEKWKQRMDYYLLALDTETREVYFISGKNIYLTKAAHLYPPVNKELPASIKDWAKPYKLEYIKDRLYAYQVPIVTEENIVTQDEEKMVLE